MADSTQQVSCQLQVGLIRGSITIESDLSLKTVKSLVVNFICEKFPDHDISRLEERILLFRHDYSTENVLKLLTSVTEITDHCVLDVVLNTQPLPEEQEVEIRPHSLSIHSYKTPTFCDFCGEMLFGMFKQGLKCEFCGLNFHKRCVFKIPNDCSHSKKRRNSNISADGRSLLECNSSLETNSTDGSNLLIPQSRGSSTPGTPRRSVNVHGRPAWVDMQMANRLKIPHTFVLHTYTKPTKCQFCNKVLVGVFKQGLQCKDCKFNVHKKCSERVPRECTGEILFGDGVLDGNHDGEEKNDDLDEDDRAIRSPDADDTNIVTPGNFDSHMAAQTSHSNIPVQRLVQSIRQTKRVGSKILKEGWVVHFTNKDGMRKKHYWRLDSKCITMFKAETGPSYYKEVPLSEILAVDTAKKLSGEVMHCFEIRTANVDFFVGEANPQNEGLDNMRAWEVAIRQALMPVQSAAGPGLDLAERMGPAKEGQGTHGAYAVEKQNREIDISQAYQIFPDEVLGSGQFGIVYGGVHRMSSRSVAIKVIDKMRFPTKQETALKNEVSILQNLDYPGVVNLEKMFETPERIFVVMEKLRGDMLEMILSSEQARLSERITKFLVTQILVALKHLHSKNIVHCDLKPENVLLSSDSDFPQVKLCDFGFARIIGEKGFRKSVVGTPAYLAPEVLRNKGYNRSLDMWSTGVIIYVSLSGTFPFNEDEDIHEQIQNASFMYPPHPWKEISSQAIDIINNLLQVKMRKRYSVDKSLMHPWLQDYQCWCDLRDLETRVDTRWLTHQSDDTRWENYGRQRHLSDVNEKVSGVEM